MIKFHIYTKKKKRKKKKSYLVKHFCAMHELLTNFILKI